MDIIFKKGQIIVVIYSSFEKLYEALYNALFRHCIKHYMSNHKFLRRVIVYIAVFRYFLSKDYFIFLRWLIPVSFQELKQNHV